MAIRAPDGANKLNLSKKTKTNTKTFSALNFDLTFSENLQ